jgi:hypothetical protein
VIKKMWGEVAMAFEEAHRIEVFPVVIQVMGGAVSFRKGP